MLLEKGDGTFVGGPADIICILKLPDGKFHAAFFEEHPLPGPVKPISELSMLRLKSKMHHTAGADTLEGAQQHLRELRAWIVLPDANVLADTPIEVNDPLSVWVVPNWTLGNCDLQKAILR